MNTRTGATTNRLHHLREAAGLTQQQVADRINAHLGVHSHGPVTDNAVSRWERGQQHPQIRYRRALAAIYGVTIADLDITTTPTQRTPPTLACLTEEPEITVSLDPRVEHSQQQWRRTRRGLNTHRPTLARLAAGTYPADRRLGNTGLLVGPGWLPDHPVDLTTIKLDHLDNASAPAVTGTEPAATHVRPCYTLTAAYRQYTHAVRDLEQPRLFENRATWRLLGVDWTNGGHMTFGDTSYFAAVDVCEAVAHETALVALDDGGQLLPGPLTLRDLPFRRLIGDPFNPDRPPVTPAAIGTLTVRGGSKPTFLLHRRDSRSVAIAGGMLQVIPSGVFQPSSVPAVMDADFDLWRNVMREFSEELLGNPEHHGDSGPADYTAEPFAILDEARRAGRLRIHCLGAGLDGLTLFGEILTVAVLDPDLFDQFAADFVATNDEGTVIAERLPLDEATVRQVLTSGRMAPAGAGCLTLAWRHRGLLL